MKNKAGEEKRTGRTRGGIEHEGKHGREEQAQGNKQTYEYYLEETGVRTLHTRGLEKTIIRHRLTRSH